MSDLNDLHAFVGSTFRSVWSLELLLLLKSEARPWARPELVTVLRASDLVVSNALHELLAAGLITLDGESAQYLPINPDVASKVEQIEKLYASKPDALRRTIVTASSSRANAFADAFRLRKD